eukprot:TRINITY_DN39299_c0_g1_i1.p1 TRINITY_DN39299_c0_g1~~TRINITY_DN39299_c0_g1_i1.p1  ORF type:complete len:212 (-),score=44.26 TRINITY_DN39299_c0_g1_i1:32-643(-)
MAEVKCESVLEEIEALFQQFGNSEYTIGEPITQMEHAVQAGGLGLDVEDECLAVAGFLHDIGHLMGMRDKTPEMMDQEGHSLGAMNHEHIAADFLAKQGFPESVYAPIRMHCDAKRYLMTTNDSYKAKVSPASLGTFVHQGGYMDSEEVSRFEGHPHFERALKLRRNDEDAKLTGVEPSETKKQFHELLRLTKKVLLNNTGRQ